MFISIKYFSLLNFKQGILLFETIIILFYNVEKEKGKKKGLKYLN